MTNSQQFRTDSEYFSVHYAELVEEYPEQWVAIYRESVEATSPDFYALLTILQERGLPIEDVVIEHVTRNENVWIL